LVEILLIKAFDWLFYFTERVVDQPISNFRYKNSRENPNYLFHIATKDYHNLENCCFSFLAGRHYFREFLRSEYSEENFLFWMSCESLKNEQNPDIIEEKARLIYEDYISILSPKEVRRLKNNK
jgi:hypothetical protein